LFYRFDLWAHICNGSIKQFVQQGKWLKLMPTQPKANNDHTESKKPKKLTISDFVKLSALRLIPKKNSVRPITSLTFYNKEREYKKVLNDTLNLLKKVGRVAAFD